MAIIVTKPVAIPTGLTATLVAGGTLAANTTYYYVVVAYDQTSITPNTIGLFNFHSDISAEGSFTTDTINRSVLIKWTNSAGATRYQILLSTTSGNYGDSGGYENLLAESVGNISDGTVGYTITALSTNINAFHTCQSKNAFVGGISKDLGIIKVEITSGTYNAGSAPYGLQSIYDAVVAAGFGAYVFYDGYTFVLKGWIITTGTVAGTFTTYWKNIVFIKGGLHLGNPNYKFYFGAWINDTYGSEYAAGCNIDIQNARLPFRTQYANTLFVYGGRITRAMSRVTSVAETRNFNNYTAGQPLTLTYYCDGIRDSELGFSIRGYTSELRDLKCGIENNFGTPDIFRLRFTTTGLMHYQNGGRIYACTWLYAAAIGRYVAAPSFANYYSLLYDCMFPFYSNNIPPFYYSTAAGNTTANSYTDLLYSMNFNVVDVISKDAISGVNINIKDKDGNNIDWVEHDTTFDKKVTGNTYSTDRVTDANGNVNTYYLLAYRVNLNPTNTIAATQCTNVVFTYKYPFTVTISKAGYETQTLQFKVFTKPTDLSITLTPSRSYRSTIRGRRLKVLNPEKGSGSKLLEL